MDDHRRAETVAHLQGATEACHLRPELVAELRRLYDAWPAAVGLTVHELLEVAEREGLC